MSKEIENFKTVIVKGVMVNNAPFFNSNVNVEFIPDEVVIKRISIQDADADNADGMFFINTDMVFPNIIHSYAPMYSYNNEGTPILVNYYCDNCQPNTRFKITQPMNSLFKFWITDINNAPPKNSATFSMGLALTLEFIQYKK